MSLVSNLPHLVTINRTSYTKDAYGGDVPTGTAYATNEPAWVQPASPKEIEEFKLRNQDVTHKVYLQRDPGLKLDDDVLVLNGPYAGIHLNPRSWADCTAGLGVLVKLFANINRQVQA